MNNQSLNDYLKRAQAYQLSTKDYDRVADVLNGADDDEIRLKCVLILRREASAARTTVVRACLGSRNSILQEETLRFLVRDIDRADLCLEELLQALDHDDELGFLQLTAIQLAGEGYRTTKNDTVLKKILSFLDHSDQEFRLSAAGSLVNALAPNYETMLPGARARLRREADINDYRRQAEAILRHGSAKG